MSDKSASVADNYPSRTRRVAGDFAMQLDYSRNREAGVKGQEVDVDFVMGGALSGQIPFSGWGDVVNALDIAKNPDYLVPVEPLRNAMSGVYFLFLRGQLVYVGQGRNVSERICAHTDKEHDSYRWMPAVADQLDDLEAYFIACLRPPLNKSIPLNSVIITRKQALAKVREEYGLKLESWMLAQAGIGTFFSRGTDTSYYYAPTIRRTIQTALRVSAGVA